MQKYITYMLLLIYCSFLHSQNAKNTKELPHQSHKVEATSWSKAKIGFAALGVVSLIGSCISYRHYSGYSDEWEIALAAVNSIKSKMPIISSKSKALQQLLVDNTSVLSRARFYTCIWGFSCAGLLVASVYCINKALEA